MGGRLLEHLGPNPHVILVVTKIIFSWIFFIQTNSIIKMNRFDQIQISSSTGSGCCLCNWGDSGSGAQEGKNHDFFFGKKKEIRVSDDRRWSKP